MRPPILLTASQAEQIVEMGGDLENVIIADRLPPIPESCQEYTVSDESQILTDYTEFTPEFEYLLSRSRNGPNIQSIQTENSISMPFITAYRERIDRDWPQSVEQLKSLQEKSNKANDKMHNCPYFANSPYLKCTANPTNTNCLECKAY